ncbi:hypothetical protein GCM10010211_62260 [Streptomyces albospinus]|uniref:Uncharacterized protein n=1 Tax=Streptomyces albospinus TaxID=285515 RepID=A0ABQ2VLB8_9ACTN|nr:hypothetical protein [Streptomyces albospinus]GGU87660.1 hypothetical protein GCM10010211_62260 [Streptomyces albospinus]
MADDDRYSWLDKDAAERLLRGEPVSSRDGDGAHELEQLLTAAAAVGSGLPESAVLPGEEAALAAFRQAGHGPDARARDAARAGRLPTVHAARSTDVAERTRLARPFRRGFAVALAVCAIGGIAVAAGTGVLPTPFRGGEPEPGASVSAAESPSPLDGGQPAQTGGETSRTPGAAPGGRTATPGPTPTPGGSPGSSRSPATPGPADGILGGTIGGDGKNLPGGANKKNLLLTVCTDYESGKRGDMDRDTLKRLESKAGGPDKVHAFCRQYLAQSQTGGSTGDNDGLGGGSGHSGGQNGSGGGGGGGGGGQNSSGGSGDEEGDSSPSASPSVSPPPAPTTPAPTPSTASPTPA